MPPTPFLAVYTINAPIGDANLEIYRHRSCSVEVFSGPFAVHVGVPVRHVFEGGVSMTMDVQPIPFPPGRYLIISTERADEPDAWKINPSIETSEIAARIGLLFPGLIDEHRFEGFVSQPGHVILGGSHPMRIGGSPDMQPAEMTSSLAELEDALESQSPEVRQRFRLASRWFQRGIASKNLVDRLLNWYIALEVHPAEKRTKVATVVSRYLQERAYPDLAAIEVKARIGIGALTTLRGKIVHDGMSDFSVEDEPRMMRDLDRLEATVRVCLRLLAGLPGGGLLDRWVRPSTIG